MYISPKKVRKGSRVAIVAPASPVHPDRLMEGLDIIRQAGLFPVLGPCVKYVRTEGVTSAPLSERVDELHWAFSSPEISAVICALGGEGSAALLPHLDYEMIKQSRKPLLGRSDITALNMGLLKNAGLISISGQTPSIHLDRGEKVRQLESDSFMLALQLLMSEDVWDSKPFCQNINVPRTVSVGFARGIAMGGNVDTFTRLLGTPYSMDMSGAIVFMEDVHKGSVVLDREFLHMKLAGIIDKAAGFVIGEFCDAGKDERMLVDEVVKRYFESGTPCSYGYSFSHGPVVSPIPIGAVCNLNADSCDVSFDFAMG